MAWIRERWIDFFAAGLIAIVLIVVVSEEVLGLFIQKPIGGIVTLGVMGILGYMYFSK